MESNREKPLKRLRPSSRSAALRVWSQEQRLVAMHGDNSFQFARPPPPSSPPPPPHKALGLGDARSYRASARAERPGRETGESGVRVGRRDASASRSRDATRCEGRDVWSGEPRGFPRERPTDFAPQLPALAPRLPEPGSTVPTAGAPDSKGVGHCCCVFLFIFPEGPPKQPMLMADGRGTHRRQLLNGSHSSRPLRGSVACRSSFRSLLKAPAGFRIVCKLLC